ncbi:hypothetical protein [Olleya sp. R77988]|uniref:hypothetical protein n=1 Tax=Olleya sp. R77988 TaxID=3093875 RepID=UPI0037C4F4E8
MKHNFKTYLKFGLFLFGITLFFYSCQKEDDLSKQGLVDDIAVDEINIKTIVGKQIPKNITNFLNDKTDNTLQFGITNKKIQPLNQQIIASRGVDLEIGTVDTSKSAMVVNETNTKYTFEMINSDVSSKHNLVVIDLGTDIVNYYISYKPEASWSTTHDITKDMRFFTGDIIFYNTDGVESSVLKIVNGSVDPNTSNVVNDPCDEVEEEEEEPDDTTNDNTTGSTGGSSNSGNSGSGSNPANGGGSDANTELPFDTVCEYTIQQECTGGGHHTDPNASGCNANDGWSVTFTALCSNLFGRTAGDPISDCVGDVGVLIFEDDCSISDDAFNATYSANSPFNVDLSNLRAPCDDTIDTTNVAENAKFMCIYNKLVNSPKFKDLFIDTFGENENLNVKFEILDIPTPNGQSNPPNGTCHVTNHTITNGEVTNVDITIQIDRNYINNSGSFFVAQTVMHESIHAYLQLKMLNCDLGTSLEELNNSTLGSLLTEYFDGTCTFLQEDHEFMFNFMIPTLSNILGDIKDDLISETEQQAAESQSSFQNENTINGLPYQPWDWEQFYYYTNLLGLHNTTAFTNEIEASNQKITNFYDYKSYSTSHFNTPCND